MRTKRIISIMFLVILCASLLSSCGGKDKTVDAFLTPEKLTNWRVNNNSAASIENFNELKEKYDGKYVYLSKCEIKSIRSKRVIVSAIDGTERISVYVNRSELSKLSDLERGDIISFKGTVKAKNGLVRHFILKNAIIIS